LRRDKQHNQNPPRPSGINRPSTVRFAAVANAEDLEPIAVIVKANAAAAPHGTILHGSSYITNDLDICCSGKPDNLRRPAKAMAPLDPKPRDFPDDLPFIWDEVTLRNGAVFTLTTDLGSIGLLAQVSGVGDFDQVRANSLEVQAFDRTVWTLDLPALIRAKRSAGRDKDLRLLPELESLLDAGD
jgi:hypothetical protein